MTFWVFPKYGWYGLEKAVPITRISPKYVSDWTETMIWPFGFNSFGMWRSVITFFPAFRGSAVPSSTKAMPSDKTQSYTTEDMNLGNTAVTTSNLATFNLHFPASLDTPPPPATATFSAVSFWVSAATPVWDLLVSLFHLSVAGIAYKISRFVWTGCSYLLKRKQFPDVVSLKKDILYAIFLRCAILKEQGGTDEQTDPCLLRSAMDRSKYIRTIQLHWAESLSKRQSAFTSS
jgi:hypothetical protein